MDKQDAPTTIKEVGIHITYMTTAINELKKMMADYTKNLATKEEVMVIDKRVDSNSMAIGGLKTSHDEMRGAINLLKGAIVLLTAISAIIGALWWVRG